MGSVINNNPYTISFRDNSLTYWGTEKGIERPRTVILTDELRQDLLEKIAEKRGSQRLSNTISKAAVIGVALIVVGLALQLFSNSTSKELLSTIFLAGVGFVTPKFMEKKRMINVDCSVLLEYIDNMTKPKIFKDADWSLDGNLINDKRVKNMKWTSDGNLTPQIWDMKHLTKNDPENVILREVLDKVNEPVVSKEMKFV